MAPLCILLIIALFTGLLLLNKRYYRRKQALQGKSIFITGCDSGYGLSLALWCKDEKMKVLASCLEEGEGWEMLVHHGVTVTKLDLTNQDHILGVAELIEKHFGYQG